MFPSGDIQRKRLRKESENDKHAVASYGISPEKAYFLFSLLRALDFARFWQLSVHTVLMTHPFAASPRDPWK